LGEQLSFANHLFEEGDYFRAITEYKRFIFLSSSSEEKLFAKKRILSSYKKAHRYDDALDYINTFQNEVFKDMESGKLLLLKGNREKARFHFNNSHSDTSRILEGWSYIEEGNWKESTKQFSLISEDTPLYTTAQKLKLYTLKAEKGIEQKNIVLSAIFSSIVPGAGRFYTGRAGDGFYSFLTIAIPGALSYFYWQEDRKRASSIAISITALFYAGNIYGSIISAKAFNNIKKNEYKERIEKDLSIKERFIK